MRRRSALVGAAALWLAAGCAAVPPAQVGQTAGTLAGAAIVPGIGAPIGALIGVVAGMLVQGQLDKATEKRERRELGDQLHPGAAAPGGGDAAPTGSPVRVWVDETVREGRLVAGHFDVRHVP
jgi:hypothetical protein